MNCINANRPGAKWLWIMVLGLLIVSCQNDPAVKDKSYSGPLFTLLPPNKSKIDFRNTVAETNDFNFIKYLYMYNGGGVSLGDVNNDGLIDVYLTANQKSNKLYLNQGDLTFKDITAQAGIADATGWSSGTAMIDINNDGLLDLYVCKSGSVNNPALRKNKLFINQSNNTFSEEAAKYGLDDSGFSSQAYFLDYDKDGDLDMYLVNHRADFENTIVMSGEVQKAIVADFSDKLFRNDGNRFSNVTVPAGLVNKAWGLSAAICDYNDDGWPDIYVCNDFLEPDHLYINNKNGSFKDEVLTRMDHISYYSMGSDVADINNDGRFDLMVLDMVSEDHARSKQNMAGMSSNQFHTMVANNYHRQYMANMLQLNQGKGVYSEVAHLAGVSKTDWSWAPLFADFDNDGYRDLYITNGIKRDMTDNDYKNRLKERSAAGQMTLDDIFQLVPSIKVKNYGLRNNHHLHFENKTNEWGLQQDFNSNGAAYGDLDNDGDLDLVVNNLEDFAAVYENHNTNNFLRIQLKGPANNVLGIGAKIRIQAGPLVQHYQHYLNRGFQSSVSPVAVFGLGGHKMIGQLEVVWPDGRAELLNGVAANKTITLDHAKATQSPTPRAEPSSLLSEVAPASAKLDYEHLENEYDDFKSEILLPYRYSTLGPRIAAGDVNGDGRTDFYLSGAQDMTGRLFLQNDSGQFAESNSSLWESEKHYEDIDALFFDSDGDKDLDLYIVSGGNEANRPAAHFQDRLYLNDGKGNFSKGQLPAFTQSGGVVVADDYDGDGDEDLFVGGRIVPGKYPVPASSVLLKNEGGRFSDVTAAVANELKDLGLVTDAAFSDYDGDGDRDLLVVGEWLPLVVFENDGGQFARKDLTQTTGIGWWYHISPADLDGDGDQDYLLGNLGLNNKYGGNKEKPFHVFCDDFDGTGNLDIVLSKEYKGKLLPVRGRECSSEQMPFIKDKFPTFKSFAEADLHKIYGKEKIEGALHYEATNFESGILWNKGQGQFEFRALPIEAQKGPTLCSVVADVNKDGHPDIVGGGSIFNAEVETVRFDGSKGYILLGDGAGEFSVADQSGFVLTGNVKDMITYRAGEKDRLLVVKNQGGVQLFEVQ